MFGFKTGAKQEDKNKIRLMAEQGLTVEQISNQLLIRPECVKSFYDRYTGKDKKTKAEKPMITEQPKEDEPEAKETEAEDIKPKRKPGRPPKNTEAAN